MAAIIVPILLNIRQWTSAITETRQRLLTLGYCLLQRWTYIEISNVVELFTFTTALAASVGSYCGLNEDSRLSFLVVSVLFGYITLLLYFQR